MPPPIPRCSSWARSSLNSPSHFSLPRYGSRVGPHIVLFEACSAFTRVAACTLALSPIRDTLIEGFSHFVTSMTLRLLPAGAVAGWGLHPLESAAFPRRTPGADISGTSVVGFGSKANREHALTAGRDRALVISRSRWLVRWLGSTCQGADQARSSAYDPARESHLRTPSRCRVAKYWVLQRQIELDRHRGGLMPIRGGRQ